MKNTIFKFEQKWQKHFADNKIQDPNFLDWFIGLTEGINNCFVINKDHEVSFVITQKTENIKMLNFIRDTLKMGYVTTKGKISKFTIYNVRHIYLIILLFNGNIILPTNKNNFSKFIASYNKRTNFSMRYVTNSDQISLSTAWLVGFAEAKGCFSVKFLTNSPAYRIRFTLSLTGDINVSILSKLILLFNAGIIEAHSKDDEFLYIISGLKYVKLLFPYFDKYQFFGIQKEHYLRFKLISDRLDNDEHLNPNTRKELTL
jgi:hypothetical protein